MISFKQMVLNESKKKYSHKELGEVKFLDTSLNDPHIKNIIDRLVKLEAHKGATKEAVLNRIKHDYEQHMKDYNIKTVHETTNKNALEYILFNMYKEAEVQDDEAPIFSQRIFSALNTAIRVENKSLFPLVSIVTKTIVSKPMIYFVPNPKLPADYNKIDTAAATNDGKFIFSIKYMQQLLNFGYAKGIKPQGSYYECNGGEIPDAYGYIEFLILHEYYHYVYADWHFEKKLGLTGKMSNIVGDFRSNYDLVKNGYTQLPEGLYSDYINYDRQDSYEEMVKIVKDAFKEAEQEPPKGGGGSGGGGEGEGESVFKVGDEVINPETGEWGVVTKASDPDANGIQEIEFDVKGKHNG